MTGLNAFLVLVSAAGLLFFALVEMAFTRLMRLPERLEAERESEDDVLPVYLEDPMRFFVPARVMRGALLILCMALLAQHMQPGVWSVIVLFGSGLLLAIVVGQFVPAIVVRRAGPERTLELLLPLFTMVANLISPLTALIVNFRSFSAWGSPAPSAAPPRRPGTRRAASRSCLVEPTLQAEAVPVRSTRELPRAFPERQSRGFLPEL